MRLRDPEVTMLHFHESRLVSAATYVATVPPPFTCAWHDDGIGAAWVRMTAELDLTAAPRLAETLRSHQREETRLVILDLCELTFLDTAGVHAIVDASVEAHSAGRRLLLRAPTWVQRVFVLTGTSSDLEFFDPIPTREPVIHAVPHLARRRIAVV